MKQRKELAKLLYIKGICTTQTELADRIAVSPNTITKWKNEGRWDDYKKSLLTTRQEELSNLYDQLSELNATIKERPKGKRYASSREADTLTKLTAAIRQLETETSVAQVVDVFMGFMDFVRGADLSKAKELIGLQDAYIRTMI